MIGTSLNQYRITASPGTGGMGEVFRARDTRLNRDMALKVLPSAWSVARGLIQEDLSGPSHRRCRN
jgi:hypothetical protein